MKTISNRLVMVFGTLISMAFIFMVMPVYNETYCAPNFTNSYTTPFNCSLAYSDNTSWSNASVQHGEAYKLLSPKEQMLYDILYKIGTEQYVSTGETFTLYKTSYTADQLCINDRDAQNYAMAALNLDNPEKVQFERADYSSSYFYVEEHDNNIYAGCYSNVDVSTYNAQIRNAVQSIIGTLRGQGKIDTSSNDAKAITAFNVYEFFYHYVTYDQNYAHAGVDAHTAYSALVNRYAVCDGYSHGYACVLKELGIPSLVVTGLVQRMGVNESHAWNIVLLSNQWYEEDVTWGNNPEYFFNRTTSEYAAGFESMVGTYGNHIRESDSRDFTVKLPIATGTYYTYDKVQELIAAKNGTTNSGSQGNNDQSQNNSQQTNGNTQNPGGNKSQDTSSKSSDVNADNNTAPEDMNSSDGQQKPSNSTPAASGSENAVSDETENVDTSVPTPQKLSVKAGSRSATIKWKKQTKNTKGYEIQYSTDKSFKKDVKKASVKKSATSKTLKKLKSGKKYYVRIRAKFKKDGKTVYSEWSKVKKIKIK